MLKRKRSTRTSICLDRSNLFLPANSLWGFKYDVFWGVGIGAPGMCVYNKAASSSPANRDCTTSAKIKAPILSLEGCHLWRPRREEEYSSIHQAFKSPQFQVLSASTTTLSNQHSITLDRPYIFLPQASHLPVQVARSLCSSRRTFGILHPVVFYWQAVQVLETRRQPCTR